MSLISAGGLLRWPNLISNLNAAPAFATENTLDAAGEYQTYVFQAREAMTVSHVGWRTGTVAGSPTADTRLETVGTDGLPTGTLWAANTNIVSGTLSSNTFTLHALTASATIARGEFFAVKMVYNSGTSIIVSRTDRLTNVAANVPYKVTNVTGSAVKAQIASTSANVAFGSSTTTFYNLDNAYPVIAVTNSTFSNSVAGSKRGLRFQVPFPCRACGLQWYNSTSAGDFNAHLFNDAGTELSSSSTAFEGDRSGLALSGVMVAMFDNPVELSPGTWYRATVEPSSATNITVGFAQMPSASYLSAWPHQANAHYTTFTTAGGWVDSATDSVPFLELILDRVGGRPLTINNTDQVR